MKIGDPGRKLGQGLLLFLALLAAGCAAGDYARLKRSPEIEREVAAGRLPGDFALYFTGREHMPYAVVGIDRRYRLTSRFWRPLPASGDLLAAKVAALFDRPLKDAVARRIVDAQGETLGFWYSTIFEVSVKVDTPGKSVEILFRNPELDAEEAFFTRE